MNKKAYLTSLVYTFATYLFIRLIDDPYSSSSYLFRAPTHQIIIENLVLFLMFLGLYNRHTILKKKYNKLEFNQLSRKTFSTEILKAFLICLLFSNCVGLPFLLFSYDGIQWWDVVEINMIPTFVVMIHYLLERTNYYINLYVTKSVENEKIRTEQLHTELKFLKSQIQPHFLFNALNTVYFQMGDSVDEARQTIEKLSNMLRYRLYGNSDEMTSLGDEFEYLENYLELNNTRYKGQLKLIVHIDKSFNHYRIYPFLMLPLVENAFKHLGGRNEISIDTQFESNHLIFNIKNSIKNNESENPQTHGIGIQNLRKRLELLYPGEHELSVSNHNNSFCAILKVKLYED